MGKVFNTEYHSWCKVEYRHILKGQILDPRIIVV